MNRNYQTPVNLAEATKRWGAIVEKLGITDPNQKLKMVEYAQIHADTLQSGMIKENAGGVAFSGIANTAGMGAVVNPTFSGTPGLPGGAGSGDIAQTLLPGALKIWAQTPGLELVRTVNVNSNKVSLLYFDYKYDDTTGLDNDERSTTFKIAPNVAADLTALKTWLRAEMIANNVTELRGRISKSLYFNLSYLAVASTATAPGASAFAGVAAGYDATVKPVGSLQGWVEFVGFGRIDDLPILRAYIQPNTASAGQFSFNQALNTFPPVGSIAAITLGATLIDTLTSPAAQTVAATSTAVAASLCSLAEEFIDGFVTGRSRTAMTRGTWDATYADKIGPDSFTKDIEIGVAHVKASLRLSEMDDYKKMYGINIVERTKAQCINLMSQQISIEIVNKVKELGDRNRAATAANGVAYTVGNWGAITDPRVNDLSVPAVAAALGGEHNASIANRVIRQLMKGSYHIANDGRIGGAEFIVTSAAGASVFSTIANYSINPLAVKMAGPGNLQPAGTVEGMKVYVDPFMNPSDVTFYLGRIAKQDEPGIVFLAYILAQSVEIVSEATMGQTMYMYSRYAVAELGFFPERQYLTIKVNDPIGII